MRLILFGSLVLASCASQTGTRLEVRSGVVEASSELMKRGEVATAEAMLTAAAERTEAELALLYRSLGAAAEAQGQKDRAEFWYRKSVELAKFRVKRSSLPLPADLPSSKLP